jgi:beta-glucuronidase
MVTRRDFMSAAGAVTMAATAADVSGQTPVRPLPIASPSKLYPHESETRSTRDLSGVWKFRPDPGNEGESKGWQKGLEHARLIPVPCSWNEIFDDVRNYTGAVWYQTEFRVDRAWGGQRIHLRFSAVQYRAKVWLNGALLGEQEGGHLPFVFDVTQHLTPGAEHTLVVFVENELRLDRVPAVPDTSRFSLHTQHYPQTTYDFFPYSGIHRPVWLFTTPDVHVHDVTVQTRIEGGTGKVSVAVVASGGWSGRVRVALTSAGSRDAVRASKDGMPVAVAVMRAGNDGAGGGWTNNGAVANSAGPSGRAAVATQAEGQLKDGRGTVTLDVPNARLWSPADPHLYRLTITLDDGSDGARDVYSLKIGIREVKVAPDQLLLNGSPVFLRGFGKHEDFVLNGRGLNIPAIVRDFELLKWLGANSFRTSHYPYSEESMMLADEYGLLVIDETPAVSLVFSDPPAILEARQKSLKQTIADLVERDKNHPCVILWSVANEPLLKPFHTTNPEPKGAVEAGTKFFAPLFELFRKLDGTRPVTLVSLQGGPMDWQALGDVICTNSYSGWYGISGQLEEAQSALEQDVAKLRARHPGKPIMFTEFGADAIAGTHAQPPVMWSEEYQADMIEMYIRTLEKSAFIFGTHPWAFADFRTSQSIMRIGALNQKGVFTRDRSPKLAALRLRELWGERRG